MLSTDTNTPDVQDLASGYVFGEILAKNNLQSDFDQFVDSRAPAAVFNNYRRLQVKQMTASQTHSQTCVTSLIAMLSFMFGCSQLYKSLGLT